MRLGVLAGLLLSGGLLAAAPARADKVEYFVSQLDAPGFKVRLQAAFILGTLGDKRAVPGLVKTLGDNHYAVRGAAATALGSLGDASAVEPLLKAAADEEAWVRAEVMKALGRMRAAASLSALVTALDDPDWKVQHQAARALGRLGDASAIMPLARVIAGGVDSNEVIAAAKKSLLRLAPSIDAAQMQARLRESATKQERAQAAVILGILGNKAAVPALIDGLRDREAYVRGYAALALSNLGDERAIEPLQALVRNEPQERVRSIAQLALSMLQRKLGK